MGNGIGVGICIVKEVAELWKGSDGLYGRRLWKGMAGMEVTRKLWKGRNG